MGAHPIVTRQLLGAFDRRARFHPRDDLTHLLIGRLIAAQHLLDPCRATIARLLDGVDERQCDQALAQVIAGWLANEAAVPL